MRGKGGPRGWGGVISEKCKKSVTFFLDGPLVNFPDIVKDLFEQVTIH